MHKRNMTTTNKAFTIVELLLVIVVIAIIAAVSVVAYSGIQNRAISATLQSDIRNAATQLSLKKVESGNYPSGILLPSDITGSPGTQFQYTSDGTVYCLTATSERIGVPSYHIASNGSSAEEGLCSGHLSPEEIAALQPPTNCPTGYIPVPGNKTFNTNGFCVMKYEASVESYFAATSVPNAIPRTTIAQSNSHPTQSGAMGQYFREISCPCVNMSESHWLTIAANIISVPSNWSGGAVGSGFIYTGHTNGSPNSALPASSDDNDGLFGMTGGFGSGPQHNNRRTLTLTNGEVIWDFAGNVAEWTGLSYTGSSYPNNTEWNLITNWGHMSASTYAPGLVGAAEFNSSHGMGRRTGLGGGSYYRAAARGGSYGSGISAGVLALEQGLDHSQTHNTSIGFRAIRL